MSDRRGPVKAAFLLTPLLTAILALHAWGDAAAGGLGRLLGGWQYPERDHSAFQIRVPRRSDADAFAARALEEFVDQAVKAFGAEFGIQKPVQPVKVVLLDGDTDPRRFGWSAAEDLKENEGVFDAARRTIFVRMQSRIQQEAVSAALRQTAARVLLHDAGAARWSPWLAEGLVGRLESVRGPAPRNWAGELPTVKELLESHESDYRGLNAPISSRGAKLLVAYLLDAVPQDFASYYADLHKGPPAPDLFVRHFHDVKGLDEEWKAWILRQK